MNNQSQIIEKINEAKNILVTVGHSPSIDELTACLGLTLAIDKMKKHSSAIFSGQIPPIMNFLRPEKTFEDSTASFQDFIISLDKEKADKLRYKVEGDMVKIFITPYHTKLSPADLTFEEGEVNIDLVMALGVKNQSDLDAALTAHGRILHSAPIITINLGVAGQLGSINFSDDSASSYSEVVAGLVAKIDEKLFSKQVSTALLTGIVINTEQFSNARTTASTMALAGKLLASGADQQLIVQEIRANGSVAGAIPETIQEIPELENSAPLAASPENIVSELETLPPAEAGESLADFMPPPLPDFDNELPPLPDFEAPRQETAPAAEAEVEALPEMPASQPISGETIDSLPPPPAAEGLSPAEEMSDIVVPSSGDPTQFKIPT
ncbi:MAG: hypothetical protein LBL08_00530 [Candidatus Nomurabacteria bacterium]|jgi:hypothetical protein|nr:hypothetical protein [Candidatus Nomurabacteria bacterium]